MSMKHKTLLKRGLALALSFCMCLSMAACGGNKADTDKGSDQTDNKDKVENETKDSYNIAIVKQMDHPSLDEIAAAIEAELDKIAAEKSITISHTTYSGQGEQTTLQQIGDQVVSEGVDAIIPIATLAAQVMTVCAEDSKTPVIYAAISDPEAAELTGLDYVSGTSDALNTEFILDMMLKQNPDTKKVGLLYSLSEVNSATPIAEAKAYLEGKGISFVEATGNTNDEVIAAASVLVSEKVDAIFTPTDNIVMAAELANAATFKEAGIPHYTGADSFVRNGAFTTCGVNYTDLGTKTADLAYTALTEGMSGMEDFYKMDGGIITVNTETAEALQIDYSIFADMGELVEVTTTAE